MKNWYYVNITCKISSNSLSSNNRANFDPDSINNFFSYVNDEYINIFIILVFRRKN